MKIAHPPMQDYSRVSLRQNEVRDAAVMDNDDLRNEIADIASDLIGLAKDTNDILLVRDTLSQMAAIGRARLGEFT